MKNIIFSLLAFVIYATALTTTAKAGTITPCRNDTPTARKISEIPVDQRLPVKNASGAIVGSIIFKEESSYDMDALFLCGDNINYYYVKGNLLKWLTTLGKTKEVGLIYNDEYDVKAKAKTLSNRDGDAEIELSLSIYFSSGSDGADYTPVNDKVYVAFRTYN